jgi:hypothetical protein
MKGEFRCAVCRAPCDERLPTCRDVYCQIRHLQKTRARNAPRALEVIELRPTVRLRRLAR